MERGMTSAIATSPLLSTLTPSPRRRERDLRVLGARALHAAALVRLVCGERADDVEVQQAARALQLDPSARDAALLRSPLGPKLLAAVELGRRAWLMPAPASARVTSPAEAVSALGPRLADDRRLWLLALDVRLRVALARPLDVDTTAGDRDAEALAALVLQHTLGGGCRRCVVVSRRPGPAIVDVNDAVQLQKLRDAAGTVGVSVLDHVLCGDDGWVSMLRLGVVVGSTDLRYR
jgi:hypothetical protein